VWPAADFGRLGIEMSTSDYIALAAAVAAFLALVPQFAQLLRKKGRKKRDPDVSSAELASAEPPKPPEPIELNAFGKALVLTAYGLAFGVIEIVSFNFVARLYGVAIDVETMPTDWLVVFYALFIIPGLFLFWAFVHLFNLFEKP
jgi:TRAP-type C4-dicarboxylate transport system permease small subunit